jgi:hypothetical protein
VFDPTLIPLLIGTLRLALANRETFAQKEALFAVTLRNGDTLSQFLQAAGNPVYLLYSRLLIYDALLRPTPSD